MVNKVPTSGAWARIITMPLGALAIAAPAAVIATQTQRDIANMLIPGAFVLFGSCLVVRSAFVGVWVDEERILLRSWFVTRNIPVSQVLEVRSVAYSGYMNRFTESSLFRMLEVVQGSGGKSRALTFRATLAPVASSLAQERFIKSALGLQGPWKSNDPPRHSRE
jgi:hypothetical protein